MNMWLQPFPHSQCRGIHSMNEWSEAWSCSCDGMLKCKVKPGWLACLPFAHISLKQSSHHYIVKSLEDILRVSEGYSGIHRADGLWLVIGRRYEITSSCKETSIWRAPMSPARLPTSSTWWSCFRPQKQLLWHIWTALVQSRHLPDRCQGSPSVHISSTV